MSLLTNLSHPAKAKQGKVSDANVVFTSRKNGLYVHFQHCLWPDAFLCSVSNVKVTNTAVDRRMRNGIVSAQICYFATCISLFFLALSKKAENI